MRSIAKVLKSTGWSNNGITRAGLEKLAEHLTQCTHINELNLPDLDPERLPVFPGGLAIVYATFKSLGIEQMTVSDGALREGLILDLVGRIYDEDMRSVTVKSVVERYHTDKKQAGRIKDTITVLLTQLKENCHWAMNENCIQYLNWAADLHEIGIDIAHSQYHKHGAYIIENGDLAGFSNQDQRVLSTLVRYHRRKINPNAYTELPTPWSELAPYLTVVLRLAVLLHRNRLEQALPDIKISLLKNKFYLQFPELYLEQSPLTRADLILEADYLKAAGFKLDFI